MSTYTLEGRRNLFMQHIWRLGILKRHDGVDGCLFGTKNGSVGKTSLKILEVCLDMFRQVGNIWLLYIYSGIDQAFWR